MTDDKTYEEPEIVDDARGSKKVSQAHIEDVFRDFAHKGMGEQQRNLLWAVFWPTVGVLFVFFLVLGIIITVLFWLLPFAFAALFVTLVFFGGLAFVQWIINLFKK